MLVVVNIVEVAGRREQNVAGPALPDLLVLFSIYCFDPLILACF